MRDSAGAAVPSCQVRSAWLCEGRRCGDDGGGCRNACDGRGCGEAGVEAEKAWEGGEAEGRPFGAAVLRRSNRTFKNRFSVGFPGAMGGGLITFGILPVFGLSRRFRDYISYERQQLGHLADWLAMGAGPGEIDPLRDQARRIRFRESLQLVAALCAFAA